MNIKYINIDIDNKSLVGLAGREFGREVYQNCVEKQIDLSLVQKYSIVFPERIIMISRSFISGFTDELCKTQGIYINQFYEYFEINKSNKEVKHEFELVLVPK